MEPMPVFQAVILALSLACVSPAALAQDISFKNDQSKTVLRESTAKTGRTVNDGFTFHYHLFHFKLTESGGELAQSPPEKATLALLEKDVDYYDWEKYDQISIDYYPPAVKALVFKYLGDISAKKNRQVKYRAQTLKVKKGSLEEDRRGDIAHEDMTAVARQSGTIRDVLKGNAELVTLLATLGVKQVSVELVTFNPEDSEHRGLPFGILISNESARFRFVRQLKGEFYFLEKEFLAKALTDVAAKMTGLDPLKSTLAEMTEAAKKIASKKGKTRQKKDADKEEEDSTPDQILGENRTDTGKKGV